MKEIVLGELLRTRLERIYREMESGYDRVAGKLGFSCEGCPDNCCDSYFQHHTYAEWGYLWLGFQELSQEKKRDVLTRAEVNVRICEKVLGRGERPQVMCPLNEKGRCILYPYRLMVCRTHGVPASMTRPDGKRLEFPGCFRCQEVVEERHRTQTGVPRMERTPLLQELALLENDVLGGRRHLYPKIKLTIAQMLLQGPPSVPSCGQ